MDNGHTFAEIGAAAKRLHWNHGKGDIQWVHVYADGRIEVCAQVYRGKPRTYVGHLVNRGRSVRLHRHQTLIGFL